MIARDTQGMMGMALAPESGGCGMGIRTGAGFGCGEGFCAGAGFLTFSKST